MFGREGRRGEGLFFCCLIGWRKEKTKQIIYTGPTFSNPPKLGRNGEKGVMGRLAAF